MRWVYSLWDELEIRSQFHLKGNTVKESHKGQKPSLELIWQRSLNAADVKAFPDRPAFANSLLSFLKHSQLLGNLLDPVTSSSFGLFWNPPVPPRALNLKLQFQTEFPKYFQANTCKEIFKVFKRVVNSSKSCYHIKTTHRCLCPSEPCENTRNWDSLPLPAWLEGGPIKTHSLSCASQSSEKLGRSQKQGSNPTQVSHLFNWISSLCRYRIHPKSSMIIKIIISAADIDISHLFSFFKHAKHSKETQN